MSKQVSLTQYLIEQQRLHDNIPAQLRLLIEVVARACKRITKSIRSCRPSSMQRNLTTIFLL